MLRIKEISIFIILLSFMNISNIYSAGKSTETRKEELSTKRIAEIHAAKELLRYALEDGKFEQAKEAVELLLKNNVDINAQDSQGNTALIKSALSSESSALELAEMLLNNGADMTIKNKYGDSFITVKDGDGRTSLMNASGKGYTDIVKLLLKNNADVKTKDRRGKTALMLAAGNGHIEVIKLLLEHNADVNAQEYLEGDTALMIAARSFKPSAPQIVEMLLNNGADDTIKNNAEESFIDIIRDKPALQKAVNNYKKRVQKAISETETPFFPAGVEGIIAEYVGSHPEKKPTEKV